MAMAMVDWYVEGTEFGNCNCVYTCPCQFEGLPSEGHCRGFEVVQVDKGHFGDVQLGGTRAALVYAWPGPVFKGGGTVQAIIDEQADARQRAALATILYGGETKEAATHWWVYRAMSSTVHDPIFKPIEFEMDIEARTARVHISGVLEATGQPIKSPVTGEPHRVRIDIPNGIEFELAEIGTATTKATGSVPLDLKDRYGQFNRLRHSGTGIVHS
jgi:hypothetical protein